MADPIPPDVPSDNLPAPDDVTNAPLAIKIPSTLIIGNDGRMAREWLYFFNGLGRAVDQQISANLPELVRAVLKAVEDVLAIEGDTKNLILEMASLQLDVAANTTDITSANTNISANTGAIATNTGAISAQGAAISSLSTRLNTKDGEVVDLQNDVMAHTSDIIAIMSRLGDIELLNTQQTATISSLELLAQTQADAIAALDTRIVDLENAP